MKKILLATVALAALAAPAAAADLAARPTYTKAPVLAPLPSWAGFYLGAVGGYATEDAGTKIDATGTVRGRIGYAFDNVLLYGTGGYAWANNKITLTALGVSVSDSQFLSGWTVGAGAEFLIAPKWSLKAEYLYKSFGGKTYFNGALPTGELNLHTVQVGVNYHF